MSVTLTINGSTYSYPSGSDDEWGASATAAMQALADPANTLYKNSVVNDVSTGGTTVPLSAEMGKTLDGTQLKKDGTVALTAAWDAGSFKITAEQIESDVVTGTAPLVVASTTVVPNLNADQVDGKEANEFLEITNIDDVPADDADTAVSSKYIYENVSKVGLFQNAIVNPNGQIAQRGTTFDATTNPANNNDTWILDRWLLLSDGNDSFDVSYDSAEDAIKLDVETSKRGGICQILENKNCKDFAGESVSVSFKVKSANIAALRCAVLAWDSTADTVTSDVVSSWAATPTWAANWTAENTPGDLSVTASYTTVTIENISVDTASMANLALFIWTPNEETIGDIVYIREIQLNHGAIALSFMPRHYTDELELCQRYYFRVSGDTKPFANGNYYNATTFYGTLDFPVAMRIAPALGYNAATDLLIYRNGGSLASSAISLSAVSIYKGAVDATTGASTAGVGARAVLTGASAFVDFSAEL